MTKKDTNPGKDSLGEEKIKNKVITSLATDKEILRKLKGIAYWDNQTVTDVINEALRNHIKSYESTKGVIKLVRG